MKNYIQRRKLSIRGRQTIKPWQAARRLLKDSVLEFRASASDRRKIK